MCLRGIAALGCIAATGLWCGSAGAARVSLRDAPHVVVTGQAVWLRGRVTLGGAGRRVRLTVQQRARGRWVRRRGRLARDGRFSLPWRAPATGGVVVLRVRAVSGRGRTAVTRPLRVAVSSTRVLSSGRVLAAPAPGKTGVVRYRGQVAVRVGEFVALDIGPQTPGGLLGRVLRVGFEAGDTLVRVRPASLVEAVPEGRIGLARVKVASSEVAVPREFRSALGCSGGVAADVSGSLAVAIEPKFALAWSFGGVDSAEASATIRGDARLSARVAAAASCSLDETSVASWDTPPLRFFVGPIPVVIVPRTTLYVSADAHVDASVEAGIEGRLMATAGLRYDGDVHPIGSFEPSFSYTAPKARTRASIGARLTPSVTFLMYGQAGPRFDLSTGLQLDATAEGNPWWTLTAPVELRAGLAVPHVAELEIPQRVVLSRSFPVAQAPVGSGADSGTPVDPGPMVERARIAWDTGGSDVDLHVWDEHGNHAWFGNPDAVPGGALSGDDRDGFGPEVFSAAGGRPLTYGVCYFDDRDTGPARVAVRITDPDGTAHESVHVLAHERDHVLARSEGGFQPPAGWCAG